jgi:hypothetical protein
MTIAEGKTRHRRSAAATPAQNHAEGTPSRAALDAEIDAMAELTFEPVKGFENVPSPDEWVDIWRASHTTFAAAILMLRLSPADLLKLARRSPEALIDLCDCAITQAERIKAALELLESAQARILVCLSKSVAKAEPSDAGKAVA